MYQSVRAERLYEQIVDQIERLILSGDLLPGDRLPPERELAEQFSVSRTAVREAITALSHMGLIEVLPGRGTFVREDNSQVVRQSMDLMVRLEGKEGTRKLTEVRDAIEPGIAALAAQRAKPEQIEAMQKAMEAMDRAMASGEVEAFGDADVDFHLALAQATQNSLFPTLLDPIVELLKTQRIEVGLVAGARERGQAHHRQILAAVRGGDPAAAEEAMRRHVHQVIEEIERSYEEER